VRQLIVSFLFSALISSGGYSSSPNNLYATYTGSTGAALDTGSFSTGNARSVTIRVANTGTAVTGTVSVIINLNSGENYVIGTTTVNIGSVALITWGDSVSAVIGAMAAPSGVTREIITAGLPANIEVKVAAATNATPSIIVWGGAR
jgi:hypothetical protein